MANSLGYVLMNWTAAFGKESKKSGWKRRQKKSKDKGIIRDDQVVKHNELVLEEIIAKIEGTTQTDPYEGMNIVA